MRDILEQLLRAADVPNPERAEQLWAEYRAGGPEANTAFAALLAWYGAPIYRRIWGFVRSDAADDVFQDALVKLHRERANLATFAHALRWLRTVASSQCVDAHRRETRRKARELAKAVPADSSVPPNAQFEQHEALRAALSNLSAQEREAVALVFFEELTRQDAAAVVGIHRDTFAKVLDGALAKLRGALALVGVVVVPLTVESVLAARPPQAVSARLAELVARAWQKALAPRATVGPSWLSVRAKVLVAVVLVGGLVSVSLALFPRNPEMKTVSPPQNRARLGVERLETRDNPAGGLLDPTFGTGGIIDLPAAKLGSTPTITAIQPDGKILSLQSVVLKDSTSAMTWQPAVTRLNANGSVDTSFGTNGTVKLPVAKSATGTALTVAPDGKILVAAVAYTKFSTSFTGGDASDSEFAVARLNANGTQDNSFGVQGWWLSNPSARDEVIQQLTTVPAAGGGYSVVAAGAAGQADGSFAFAVEKLTPAGNPDASFGTGGLTVRKVASGLYSGATWDVSLAVTASGKIVLGGGSASTSGTIDVLTAFTPAGQPDTGFGTNGVVTVTIPGAIRDSGRAFVAAQGDSIVVSGMFYFSTFLTAGYVTRYDSAGIRDVNFGNGGVYMGPGGTTANASSFGSVAVEADGSIAIVGTGKKTEGGVTSAGLLVGHLTRDGAADPNFGTDGTGLVIRYDQNPGFTYSGQVALSVDADGNILTGYIRPTGNAITPNYFRLLRFTHS